jgi:hypothetical protein
MSNRIYSKTGPKRFITTIKGAFGRVVEPIDPVDGRKSRVTAEIIVTLAMFAAASIIAVLLLLASKIARADELPLDVRVIACESRGIHWKHGHLNCNAHERDGKKSCGIAQFQLPTFKFMRRKARAPWLKYNDPISQLWLFKWGMSHGYQRHWACYGLVTSGKWHMAKRDELLIRRNRLIEKVLAAGVTP